MNLDNLAIGLRLRKQREKMRLSRGKLAEFVGISDYYIGQLERGQRQMSLTVACGIANCLHISLDYLIWGDGEQVGDELSLESGGLYNSPDRLEEIHDLLNRCSDSELELTQELLIVILPRMGRPIFGSSINT